MQSQRHTTAGQATPDTAFAVLGGSMPETLARPQFRFAWKEGMLPATPPVPAPASVDPVRQPRPLARLLAAITSRAAGLIARGR